MNEPNSLEGFLDQVLSDPSLKDELSEDDLTAMKALFGNLFAAVPKSSFTTVPAAPSELPVSRSALLQAIDLETSVLDDGLEQKSDAALMQCLIEQIDRATRVINLLGHRFIGRGAIQEIGYLELQLTAVGLGIQDLQQALAQAPQLRLNKSWQQRLKNLLLQEFHFINRWVDSNP